MEQHHLIIEPDTESLPVPLDRLFRMPEEVYRQMVATDSSAEESRWWMGCWSKTIIFIE